MDDLLRMETSLKSMRKAASLVELEKEAAKVTFSPAMDESPLLKGRQSKLPDKIQAAILKKKGKSSSDSEGKTKKALLDTAIYGGVGAAMGAAKGRESGKDWEGAGKGTLGAIGGQLGGALLGAGAGSATVLAALALLKKKDPKYYAKLMKSAYPGLVPSDAKKAVRGGMVAGAIPGGALGSFMGYKHLTKDLGKEKEGSVIASGLQQASMALYTDVYGGRMEKVANPFAFMNAGRGVAKSGLGGALLGALGGGAREAARLRKLQMAGQQAHAATRKLALEAKKAREVAQASGQRWAPGLGAEGRALSRAEADAAFLDRVAPLQKLKNVARDGAIPPQNMAALPTNVMDDLPGYMKAYAPNLLRSAGEMGTLTGVGAAAGRYATNAYRKAQTLKRIKDAALPAAAVGAGGLGLYALTS